MRRQFGFFRITLLYLIFMLPTMAHALNLADVGGYDTLISADKLGNSGDATELSWVNSIVGGGYFMTSKTNTADGAGWIDISDAAGTFAFDISGFQADYFMVKTGNNTGTDNTHFLFNNTGNLNWAVIDFGAMGFNDKNIENFGKLSHINTYTHAPEPATMILLGTGLVGLSFLRRKFK